MNTLRPRVLIVVNADWYFWSHRLSLARALLAAHCQVAVAAAPERGYQQSIEAEGLRFIPLRLQRRSVAIGQETSTFLELCRLYRRERPHVVHHVTIKPVLYGSLAAKVARLDAVINTIPGLGYMFLGSGLQGAIRQGMVCLAYRLALCGNHTRVIFQNPDDQRLFLSRGLVSADRSVLIRGSGVDIRQFTPTPDPAGIPVVLLASRLLWDKGVGELVEAARQLKRAGTQCRFVLVGAPDLQNPNSVSTSDLEGWRREGVVEWWGLRSDMADVLKMANVVVLPSYREGVPRILLEAAASGRAIIATDVPGCREVVRHGENGLLVPVRDPSALASAIRDLLTDPVLRARMGTKGRQIVVSEFSEDRVLRETLAVYAELLGDHWPVRCGPETGAEANL